MTGLLTRMILYAARPYVAGPALQDAMRVARAAGDRGCGVTLCYWHALRDPAEHVAEQYLASLDALSRAGLDARISLKVPGLRGQMPLIETVMAEARARGIPADIDAHTPEQAEADHAVAQALGPQGLGIAIPGRWQCSDVLAYRAAAMGLRVRVVKGIWADPEAPDIDLAEGFLATIDRLAGRCREVGVATHDPALAAKAFRRLAAAGTPAEQELLYGLPMAPAAAEGRRAGVKTRVYIPYGDTWLPYSVRRAVQNPRMIGRLVRDVVTANRDGLPPAA